MSAVYDSIMQGLHEVAQDIAGEKKLPRNTIYIMALEGRTIKKTKRRAGMAKAIKPGFAVQESCSYITPQKLYNI